MLDLNEATIVATWVRSAALLGARDKQLVPILHKLLDEPALRAAALKGLAVYDDPQTPNLILAVYAKLPAAETLICK